jgi:transcriptional regulator with XRE-family HTH domain
VTEALGNLIASRRVARKLSQERLAQICGCSTRTIQRIESGATPNLSERMADALRKSLDLGLRDLARSGRRGRVA